MSEKPEGVKELDEMKDRIRKVFKELEIDEDKYVMYSVLREHGDEKGKHYVWIINRNDRRLTMNVELVFEKTDGYETIKERIEKMHASEKVKELKW